MPRPRRVRGSALALRWAAVVAIALAALLYYRPIRAYFETRATLASRSAEVRSLRIENAKLEARLAASNSLSVIERDARRLGYVKPGEHLYIVHGVESWRAQRRASLRRDG
jgi:cell division protein FtsB